MTISSQTNKIIYIGNGVAKEFAIPFSFLEQEHIKIRQKENDIQTERTDWEINGGNIVFKTAPESGAEIAIVREVPLTQETDYRDNEILHAETLERNFDKLTMQVQQLEEKSARAVTVDIFDDTQADSLIPSIRKAVSDCQAAANAAKSDADKAKEKAAEAQTVLMSKADVDLNNLTAAGKASVANFGMPGSNYVELTPAPSNTDFTAIADGYFSVLFSATAAGFANLAIKTNGLLRTCGTPFASGGFGMSIPIQKGDVMNLWYSAALTLEKICFIYAKGACS